MFVQKTCLRYVGWLNDDQSIDSFLVQFISNSKEKECKGHALASSRFLLSQPRALHMEVRFISQEEVLCHLEDQSNQLCDLNQ